MRGSPSFSTRVQCGLSYLFFLVLVIVIFYFLVIVVVIVICYLESHKMQYERNNENI